VQVSLAMQSYLRTGQQSRHQVTKKQRTTRMLIAVTAIFVGCWLPLNVIHLTLDYYEKVGVRALFVSRLEKSQNIHVCLISTSYFAQNLKSYSPETDVN